MEAGQKTTLQMFAVRVTVAYSDTFDSLQGCHSNRSRLYLFLDPLLEHVIGPNFLPSLLIFPVLGDTSGCSLGLVDILTKK